MTEFPGPIRLPGQPPVPKEPHEREQPPVPPAVVDLDVDVFGAEDAARRLVDRLQQVHATPSAPEDDGQLLSPPFASDRDRVDGVPLAPATLVVFGEFGTPSSRPLSDVLARVREQHPVGVAVAWRHHPDPAGHPHVAVLALAAEAAAAAGRFWALTRELLRLRHDDPLDLHAAMLRAAVDPERALAAMRAGVGTDRIVEDVVSAQRSGVILSPVLFINGARYQGELDPAAVSAAVEA